MKKFIKENLVLVLGLTLPLLLVALFFFAAILPKMLSEPPQYEMLFASTHYQYGDNADYLLDFSVKNKQVMVKSKAKDDKKNHTNNRTERLFVYDGKVQLIREIAVDGGKLVEGAEVPITELSKMVIDSSSISPDGYILQKGRHGSRGLVNGLFGGGHRSHYRLVKGNVSYKLPHDQPSYYYNQLTFLGWVVNK